MHKKISRNIKFLITFGGGTLPSRWRVMPGLALSRTRLATVFLVSAVTAAEPQVIRCLPPDVPVTDLPEAVLVEYRAEIGAEFESYFSAISAHITCLDEERARALSEARGAADAYAIFLNIAPTRKDRP